MCNFWTRKVCKFRTSWFFLWVVKSQDCSDFCFWAGLGRVRRNRQNWNITSEVVAEDLGLLFMLLGAYVQAWAETGFKEEYSSKEWLLFSPSYWQPAASSLAFPGFGIVKAGFVCILLPLQYLMYCIADSFAWAYSGSEGMGAFLVEITTFK